MLEIHSHLPPFSYFNSFFLCIAFLCFCDSFLLRERTTLVYPLTISLSTHSVNTLSATLPTTFPVTKRDEIPTRKKNFLPPIFSLYSFSSLPSFIFPSLSVSLSLYLASSHFLCHSIFLFLLPNLSFILCIYQPSHPPSLPPSLPPSPPLPSSLPQPLRHPSTQSYYPLPQHLSLPPLHPSRPLSRPRRQQRQKLLFPTKDPSLPHSLPPSLQTDDRREGEGKVRGAKQAFLLSPPSLPPSPLPSLTSTHNKDRKKGGVEGGEEGRAGGGEGGRGGGGEEAGNAKSGH